MMRIRMINFHPNKLHCLCLWLHGFGDSPRRQDWWWSHWRGTRSQDCRTTHSSQGNLWWWTGFLENLDFFFSFFGLTCLWPNPSWRYPQWIHPKPAKMLDLACVWEVLREFERDFERVWEGLRGFGECLRGFESLKISQNLSNESN